jgi:hypothetical protein
MTAQYFGSLTPVGMPHAIGEAVPCAFFGPAKAHPDHNRLSGVLTVATPTVWMSDCSSKYLGRWCPAKTCLQSSYGFLWCLPKCILILFLVSCELYAVILPSVERQNEKSKTTTHFFGIRRLAINIAQASPFTVRLSVSEATRPASRV